ncbi:hypothetical protein Glove_99g174 [Diversispora epigaea]|uniref:Uncharacterized protein n=1 Tax=Diversispora epigaea TaxID=1348612 RepID=A0A397JD89_9GLOM|nr:hypothetical protein Glove_99g174 [Diversispora epigaea]
MLTEVDTKAIQTVQDTEKFGHCPRGSSNEDFVTANGLQPNFQIFFWDDEVNKAGIRCYRSSDESFCRHTEICHYL